MPRYKLEKPHFLGNRYYAEGAVVEYEGEPSRSMTPVDAAANERKQTYDQRRARPTAKRERLFGGARAVAQPGGSPPDPTWAPEPRPAFSVITENVKAGQPRNPEPDMVRVPAGTPTASTVDDAPAGEGDDAGSRNGKPAAKKK